MTITKQTVAAKISAHLHHELSLVELVDWAKNMLLDGELSEDEAAPISFVVASLGMAEVRTFGLAWNDCEKLLHQLGFTPRIEVVAV